MFVVKQPNALKGSWKISPLKNTGILLQPQTDKPVNDYTLSINRAISSQVVIKSSSCFQISLMLTQVQSSAHLVTLRLGGIDIIFQKISQKIGKLKYKYQTIISLNYA